MNTEEAEESVKSQEGIPREALQIKVEIIKMDTHDMILMRFSFG